MTLRGTLRGLVVAAALVLSIGVFAHARPSGQAAATDAAPALTIGGDVPHPLQFSAADFAKLPHISVNAYNGHDKKRQTYSGVLLRDLLKQVGVPSGEDLRGKWVNCFLEMEAADGYKVIFALAEMDTSFQDNQIIVADKMDGADLGRDQGPLKLVAPEDKRPGRWIRQLQKITVRQAAP